MFMSPFNPITGNGLGVSYSSLNQIGGIFPQKGIGQANVLCFVNMINGNLIIKDHMVKLMELNGPMELGFYFNTQVAAGNNNWQFAIKKLILPVNNQTITLQEKDGHLTSYTSTNNNNIFTAPALNDGTPYLTKLGDGTWLWYHPKTQISEIYNANGLLISVTNALGNTTNFIYDANNNLTNINGPGGDTYQITRTGTNIFIYDTSTGNNNLLQSSTLDNQGRITTTQTPDGYQVNYFYSNNSNGNYLNKITQSDGTSIQFNNNISATFGNQVASFQLGTDVNYNFTYPNAQNPNTAIVADGVGATTTFTLDQNNRTSQIAQQTGFDVLGNEVDLTTVTYNAAGQVQTITKPEGQLNNQSTSYQYGIFGLITQKTDPNGQIAQFNYYNDVNCAVPIYLISKTQIINNQNLTTYYIYDTDYNDNNYIFKRFMISPTGRVTQYQPDYDGNVEYVSQFFNAIFNTTNLNPTTPTPLQQLTTWATQQFAQNLPQQASLTNYEYDTRGQVVSKVDYANTDGQGNGIDDAFASQEENYWDEFGNLTQHEFLQIYPATTAVTNQRFDGLQRLTKNINALLEVTTYNYLDVQSQIQTIYPNNSTDTKTNEPSGLVNNNTAIAIGGNNQNQTRNTTFARDNAGHTVKTTLPDGNLLYTFYDRQNRLSIKITPVGIFSQTQYDRVHNYTATTTYANAIDTTKLVNASNPNTLPTASLALSLLTPDPLNDRTTYQFKDASNRIIWEVDGKNYGTQYFYDALNRRIAKVTYATQLSSAELTQLKQAQAVERNPDFSQDRGTQYFYDNDNNKIGKLVSAGYKTATTTDATGYLTQYFRDSASRIYKITRYATRVTLNLANSNLSQFIPAADPVNDATTYIFSDARGNKIATVDAAGYLTLFTNLPCGIPAQSIRYANKVVANWFTNPTTIPPTPASSSEDQTTIYDYDLLNRSIEATGAMNHADFIVYDVMGNKISLQTQDENNPNSVDPSCMRGTQTQFDGWNQKTAEANAFVNQLIANINANPNLSQQQKDQQIAQVWQTQSMRHTYDASGLKLLTIMPPRQNSNVNDIYYYYYDADRRPVVIVDPNGNVTLKTLNSFGEATQARLFANAISQQNLSTLTGGFITPAFQAILTGLQNIKDEITSNTYDQRGQVTQSVDANNNTTTKTYTAFKQVATENLPVANQQPSLTIAHQYEGRGYEIQITKTGGTLTTTTSSQYLNLMGKKTQYTDELNTNYITQYDPLGRIIVKQEVSVSDNLTITTHALTVDAFGRVLTDTDSQQQVTSHTYNQQTRTHTITYPINAVTKVITLNIFNQKIQIVDTLGDTEKWQYAPNGKITVYTDQLNYITTDNYDLMGRNILHIDANNIQTSKTYDGASHLIKLIADVTGLALTTQYIPDAFGNNVTIIDPRSITTTNTFDGNNNLIQSIIDPNNPGQNYTGLNIIKAKAYNGQNSLISYTLGDATTNNQYLETDQIDSLNRPTGKTVDPNNLALVTAQHLDAAGEVIANIDANGNITRTFFDGLKRKRFVVDAAGGVYERNYDTENRLIYERHYDQGINLTSLSDSTTLQQLIALVQTSAQDSYIYYFYDNNGNECFTVNSIGKVCQKIYDNAGRKIQDTIYATPNTTTVTTLNTSTLITWATQQINNAQNQTTYHILDAKGQECFTINPNKIIIQTVFDPNGNKIIQVTYANAVNPAQIIVLPLNQILANINQDNTRDNYYYKIFDNLQRPIFEVDGEGNVTKHAYDGNNNETICAKYAQKITVPQTYANIVTACNALPAPNPAVDSITQKIWDTANRNTIVKDPINNTDQFQLTVSGNVKIHTDKNNQQWTNNFDSANRLTDQYTPQVPVTVVQAQPNNKLKLLNDNNDKIISSLLTQNKKPHYPIIYLAGLGNDCALFALALAAKKAAAKKPALQNSLLHWPLIAQINEIDIAKKSARNAKIGHYLRIALIKALLQDENFKKQQWESFISFCAAYLDKQNYDMALQPITNLIDSNQTFINQMQMAWQKKLSEQTQINKQQSVSTKIIRSFIELYINANGGWADVYQRYCQIIQNQPTKLSTEEIACLANYWRINLQIILNNGDVFQRKQAADVNQIQASLCKLDEQHWQVIDVNSEPLNDNDAYNPSNLSYKIRTKDGINNTVNSSQISLTSTQSSQSAHKQFVLDKVGNKTQITEGYGTPQARTIINSFTPVNKLLGTTLNNVPVDSSSMIASYQAPPVTNATVNSKITYNAKQKKVAEQNENGQWQFYIYDSEQREVYRVSSMNNNGTISGYAITQKIYDVFNNVIQEIAYYTPTNLTITQQNTQTGIPLSVIQQAGVITASPYDRTVTKTYDNCNNITLLQQGPIFYYLPNANGSNNPQFGTGLMQTKFAYTAFNQCYFKSVLLNPQQNTWSQQLYWFDRTGKVLAECDPVYRVKIHQYDAFKNEVLRIEWGGQPSQLPTPATTYTQLIAAYNWTATDRVYSYTYDVRQLKLSETRAQKLTANVLGVIIQSLSLGNNNVPSLQNQTVSGLSKYFTYTATLQLNSIKDEAGYYKYIFYDARNIVIATTDVPRTSVNGNNQSVTLVPLTYTGNDLFGKAVKTTRFKQGTVPVTNPLQLPQPIANDPDDQTEMTYFDVRGLASWKQDADLNVTGFTYTPTRKKARSFNQLTNKTAINIDDYRITYDALDRVTLKAIYRNGILQANYQTQIQYDPFNQPIAEGDGLGNWPLYRKYDAVGNIWSTNKEGGVATIILTDLTGKISLRGQSATQDLSQTNYSNLTNLMALGMNDLERLQSQRDNSGRVINKYLPSFTLPSNQTVNPYYQFGFDNWNNKLSEINTLSNQTTFTNTIDNKCTVVIQPPVDVVNANGSTNTNINPITITGYDIRSNRIGVVSPNGNAINYPVNNTEGFQLDEAGQMIADILADGTYANRQTFDALSRITTRTDSRGKNYALIYDHRNNVITETYPSGNQWNYAYNEINHRFSQTDPTSNIIQYDFDWNHNISGRYYYVSSSYTSAITLMAYDRNRKPISIQYLDPDAANNTSQYWMLNYFGNPLPSAQGAGHSDLSGLKYYYEYDFKQQVVHKYSDTQTTHGGYLVLSGSGNSLSVNNAPATAQDLTMTYQRGLITKVVDNGIYPSMTIVTTYDSENRKINYSLTSRSTVRNLTTEYDALNREIKTSENGAKIEKYYDLNSNVRRQKLTVDQNNSASQVTDLWNTYDSANRVLLYNAYFNALQKIIEIKFGIGYQFTYKDGLRRTQTISGFLNTIQTETYDYDDDSRLSSSSNPVGFYTTSRGYDKANRQKNYTYTPSSVPNVQNTHTTYHDNGWIETSTQTVTHVSSINTTFGDNTKSDLGYMPDGQPKKQFSTYLDNTTDNLNDIEFIDADSFALKKVGGTRNIPGLGSSGYKCSQQYYDCNMNTNGQIGVVFTNGNNYNNQGAPVGILFCYTSYDGLVLTRYELIGINAVDTPTSRYNITNYYYDASNNCIAQYTISYQNGVASTPVNTLSASHAVNRFSSQLTGFNPQILNGSFIKNLLGSALAGVGLSRNFNISKYFANPKIYIQQILKNRMIDNQLTQSQINSGLDIVHPIDQSFPAICATTYVVQAGDTLAGIAQSQYGDGNKWIDIANANNITDATLAAGQILQLPQVISSQFQASSSLPYSQFMNTVLMTLYPELKVNPPKEHHSFIGEVVHAIVDTAAMILGYAIFGPIGAAIATALADAAYQDLAVHEGWQPHFMLEDSVIAGIEAGVASYIMPPAIGQPSNAVPAPGTFGTSNAVSSFGNVAYSAGFSATNSTVAAHIIQAVMEAGSIATMDQFIEMALGERNQFDFNAVLTSMASAGAMYEVSPLEGKLPINLGNSPVAQIPDNLVQNLTGNLIQTASYDALTGQTLYVDEIVAGALGSTIGQSMGEEIIVLSKQNESSTNPANTSSQNGNNAQNNSTTGNNGLNNSSSSASGNNNYINYQSSQNPGSNQSGFFNSGSVNANVSSNNESQNYSANNASGSSYGSGNSSATSKLNNSTISDSGSLNYVPFPNLNDSPQVIQQGLLMLYMSAGSNNLPIVSPYIPGNNNNAFSELASFAYALGDSLTYPLHHPINTIEGLFNFGYNASLITNGMDTTGSAHQFFSNMQQGFSQLINATQSPDLSTRGTAWGTIFSFFAGVEDGGGVGAISKFEGLTDEINIIVNKTSSVPNSTQAGLGLFANSSVTITQTGLDIVIQHLSSFPPTLENQLMIDRLQYALSQGLTLTGADASFYIHEISESTFMAQGLDYSSAHDAAIAKYNVSPYSLYHPDVIQQVNSISPEFNNNWLNFWNINNTPTNITVNLPKPSY